MSTNQQKCKNCGQIGTIIEDNSTGYYMCTNCGTVQGELLSNEAEFTELSNGNKSLNGQFIASHNQKASSFTTTASSIEGKARIQAICESLPRLENQPDVCEKAERIFKKAFHERFIRGRTVEIVSAACVYIAIRQKKTTGYLLTDIADHSNCNIFSLAVTALQLSNRFKEYMPPTDPTLFVDRFTEELKFGRKSADIKETAIQLIRRMDRDWIQSGRKPSGICGACIMIAAAKHGVQVSEQMIYKCARVCLVTINKRLKEFAQTEFAKLSFKQMDENRELIDAESSEVPPSMKIKKQLEDLAIEISKNDNKNKSEISSAFNADETFEGEDLKDVDDMILNEDEAETRAALFYALYKSKLNQLNITQNIKKKEKRKKEKSDEDKDDDDDNSINNENESGALSDDDDIVSDAEDDDDY